MSPIKDIHVAEQKFLGDPYFNSFLTNFLATPHLVGSLTGGLLDNLIPGIHSWKYRSANWSPWFVTYFLGNSGSLIERGLLRWRKKLEGRNAHRGAPNDNDIYDFHLLSRPFKNSHHRFVPFLGTFDEDLLTFKIFRCSSSSNISDSLEKETSDEEPWTSQSRIRSLESEIIWIPSYYFIESLINECHFCQSNKLMF